MALALAVGLAIAGAAPAASATPTSVSARVEPAAAVIDGLESAAVRRRGAAAATPIE